MSRDLRKRWQTADGQRLAEQALSTLGRKPWWRRRRTLVDLPLGRHGGRIDLRGLALAPPQDTGVDLGVAGLSIAAGVPTLEGVTLEAVDLSGSRLQGLHLHGCTLRDCMFDDAFCRDWRLWNCRVERCSFVRANLREAALATWPDGGTNEWLQIDFSNADLRAAVISGGVFQECTFANARLEKVAFEQSILERVTFAGRVSDVLFDGRALPGRQEPRELSADFSAAFFTDVDFHGYTLDNVRFPNDEDLTVVRRLLCVGRYLAEQVTETAMELDRRVAGVIANSVKALSASTPPNPEAAFVFNRRDWRAWGGEPLLAAAERLLADAMAACGQVPGRHASA